MDPKDFAALNLVELTHNSYPGRLVGVGVNRAGNPVLVTAITGRSKGSRNRVYHIGKRAGSVTIGKTDTSLDADVSNRFYDPMARASDGTFYIASNGVQTDLAEKGIELFAHGDLATGLVKHRFTYEPDHPNDTPRITGVCFVRERLSNFPFQLAILKRSIFDGSLVTQNFNYERIAPGFGFFLATYRGDGNPLPSFEGEPFLLPLLGDSAETIDTLWSALNEENRVSLAVMEIDPEVSDQPIISIRNQYGNAPASVAAVL